MNKAPAFQLYANDFMDLTRMWDANAVGLHARCMCIAWTHGSIPRDKKLLARAIHCDMAELEACWPVLAEHWLDNGDGGLVFSPQEAVRVRQAEVSARRKEASEKRWNNANAHANDDANTNAKHDAKTKQRKVKEKIEGEDEGTEGGTGETAMPSPKTDHRDPAITALLDHLAAALRSAGIAQSLDVDRLPNGVDGNRAAAKHILLKLAKDYPEADPSEAARHLIDIAVQHPFHGPKCTKASYIYRHFGTIIAEGRQQIQQRKTQPQTTDDYLASVDRAAAEYAARRAAGEVL